jgi:hypothetical protein
MGDPGAHYGRQVEKVRAVEVILILAPFAILVTLVWIVRHGR